MSFIQSIILGLVEGFTEFLPISSTGHLILISRLFKIEQTEFLKSFEIIIQFGAILSVIVLYFKKFLFNIEIFKRVIVAFIPTAVVGFVFYGFIKNVLLNSPTIVLWSLFLGGILIIIFEWRYSKKEFKINSFNSFLISYRQAFWIGLFQSIAVIPGLSRSAVTILGGLWLGISRKTIVEFSFILAIPTILGASALDLVKNVSKFSSNQIDILILGFIFSFFTALVAVKFLLSFIQKHSFIVFGIYRIILAVVFWFLLF
jgi:undecaprenyl-diphosphatase